MGPRAGEDVSKDREFCVSPGHQTPDSAASSIFVLLIEGASVYLCAPDPHSVFTGKRRRASG